MANMIEKTSKAAYEKLDPYLPQAAKDTIQLGIKTAFPVVEYAQKTVSSSVEYAQKVTNETVDYGKKTIFGTVEYAQKTVNGTVDYGKKVVSDAKQYAARQTNQALEFGQIAVNGATTTIHAHTPGPILSLIQSSVDGASALAKNPIDAVKPYVPSFIIHFGERSYEIVGSAQEQSLERMKGLSGFIVTKVNGITLSVTSIPIITQIIEKLNTVTEKFSPSVKKSVVETNASIPVTPSVVDAIIEDAQLATAAE
jgi:hypothetical protein